MLFFVFFFLLPLLSHASAQTPTPIPVQGKWVKDPEVTFVGKTASRADDFLNWTLQRYEWAEIAQGQTNPLSGFYVSIQRVVYLFLVLFVLATAFVIIITRGQNVTIMRFIPRFILIIALVTFSFSIIQLIYTVVDWLQGILLRPDGAQGNLISSQDLLHIAFDYNHFIGFRRIGVEYDESAFMSLLLVRLTAFTYYAMTAILLIRKVILWFFIILSPIFPLLLFYRPIRNTAKIWVGEFFRWLFYAPLFALFLNGLVRMWRERIPLPFTQLDPVTHQPPPCDINSTTISCYQTAVNILLGGPGQVIGLNNSVNLKDTFALYVVSLLILWVVILLPFLLLNIFLDYISSISLRDNVILKQALIRGAGLLKRPSTPAPPLVPPPASTGLARQLPFLNKSTATTVTIPSGTRVQTFNNTTVRESTELIKLANLSIPKMRDIARYESSLLSRDTTRRQEVGKFHSALEKIANPTISTTATERQQFASVHDKLVKQKEKGDPLAVSVLNASSAAVKTKSQAATPLSEKAKSLAQGKTTLPSSSSPVALPVVNKVQQVSLEDYEEVKKMWEENYQNLEPPRNITGQEVSREEWIRGDIARINQAIALLMSIDPQKVNEGMDMVANILPFLLLGGFSKTEIIAYLKAKLEAARKVLAESDKKQDEEDTLVSRDKKHAEAKKEISAEAELSKEEPIGEKKEEETRLNENTPVTKEETTKKA